MKLKDKYAAIFPAIIYGGNDGLASIFGLVAGVSGATSGSSRTIIVAGLLGAVAAATSMGVSGYLSDKTQQEVNRAAGTDDTDIYPIQAGAGAGISTLLGGVIPIIPFLFASGLPAMIWAFVISLAAHFVLGSSKSLFTARSWWFSGLEMTVLGVIVGVVTYLVGFALTFVK